MATRIKELHFYSDPGGGSGDTATISWTPYSGESCSLDIAVANDAADKIRLIQGSQTVEVSGSESRLQSDSSYITVNPYGAIVSGGYALLTNDSGKATVYCYPADYVQISGASRDTTGRPIVTPNNSVGRVTRYSGYLEWYSDVGAIGTTYFNSDIRKKDNISKSNISAINIIKQIEFISFDWKPDSGGEGHVKVGVSAQQLKTVEDTFVRELSDSTLMVHEPSVMPYLAKAIQEQQEIIETQQKRIDSLEERLKVLEDLLK